MRYVGIAMVAILVAALCWMWRSGADRSLPADPPSAPATAPPTASPQEAPPVPVSTDAPREAVPDPVVAAPADRDRVHVRGTIVVVDPQGGEHCEADGEIQLILWEDGHGTPRDATVRAGKFEIDLPAEGMVSAGKSVLDGRTARVSEQQPVRVSESLALRAAWSASIRLRVVDAETGVDLTGIVVIAMPTLPLNRCPHPGTYRKEDARVVDGVSPLELDPDPARQTWQESLWVGAPDHAFGVVTVDYSQGGERRVDLPRGGSLEVRLEGRLPDPPRRRDRTMMDEFAHDEPRLRVRRPLDREAQAAHAQESPRGDLVLDAEARLDAPTVLAGIAPGDYVVAVERGYPWRTQLVLGETTVKVDATGTAHATVHVEPPAEVTPVPLAGTLLLPPAWGESRLAFRFEPMDLLGGTGEHEHELWLQQMTPDAATPGLYEWRVGLVAPGRYTVKCYGLELQWIVDTGPEGTHEAEIVVPPPVNVAVQLREEESNTWIEDARLMWSVKHPEGSRSFSFGDARWNPKTGRYEFRAPAGGIELTTMPNDYTPAGERAFDVSQDHNELVLQVRRACGVVLFLKSDDAVIPWDEPTRWNVELETSAGASATHGRGGTADHGNYVTVREPGTYRVVIPDQPGFEPIAPFEIEIPKGTLVHRDVVLQPKR